MRTKMTRVIPFLALVSFIALFCSCGGMALFALKKNPLWLTLNPDLQFRGKMKVAVLDFDFFPPERTELVQGVRMTKTSITVYKHAGRMVASNLTNALLSLEQFELVERTQIERLLNEQGLTLSGVLSKTAAEDVGNILEVDAIIIGDVEECIGWMNVNTGMIGSLVSFSARMVDVKSGKILWTASHSANLTKMTPPHCIRLLCQDITGELENRLEGQ